MSLSWYSKTCFTDSWLLNGGAQPPVMLKVSAVIDLLARQDTLMSQGQHLCINRGERQHTSLQTLQETPLRQQRALTPLWPQASLLRCCWTQPILSPEMSTCSPPCGMNLHTLLSVSNADSPGLRLWVPLTIIYPSLVHSQEWPPRGEVLAKVMVSRPSFTRAPELLTWGVHMSGMLGCSEASLLSETQS